MEDVTKYLRSIAALGRNGDSILAHITPEEAKLLKSLGGAGSINPATGLPEFFFEDIFSGVGDFFGGIGDSLGSLFDVGGGEIVDSLGASGVDGLDFGSGFGDFGDIFSGSYDGVAPDVMNTDYSGGASFFGDPSGLGGAGAAPMTFGDFDGNNSFGNLVTNTGSGPNDWSNMVPNTVSLGNIATSGAGNIAPDAAAAVSGSVAQEPWMANYFGPQAGGIPVPPIPPVAGAAGAGALGSTGDWLSRNANWMIPAAGLAYSVGNRAFGGSEVPYQGQIAGNSNFLSSSGRQLTDPLLNNAPLPAGAQSAIDRAAAANSASIRSTFANMGLSGSTMEAQALQNVRQAASEQYFKDAAALAAQGFSNIGASSAAYNNLANAVMQSDNAFTQALAAFSGALGRSAGLNYNRPGVTPYG